MNRTSRFRLQRVRAARTLAALVALALLSGCDNIEWGGIAVELREPVYESADSSAALDSLAEPPPLAMPSGPLLFHVRQTDESGSAIIEPVAELSAEELRTVGPRRAERAPEYVDEFVARYFGTDQAYTLFRGGARVGTFYVRAPAVSGSGLCLELRAEGQVEYRPRADTLSEFLAWSPGVRAGQDTLAIPAYRSDMLSLSQVLARLGVREREIPGVWRFRAPADLRALRVGIGSRGFAAAFVVSDSLGTGSPADSAGSVFIVADYDPSRGYFPIYFDAAWYGPGQKRALRWLDAVDLSGDAELEWLLRAYGDAGTWYELVGRGTVRDTVRTVLWSSRQPLCEAESSAGGL
ncbi:MAG: hypothetical protein JSW46_08205 [Gemmatimonadota bacterium]|nr:MAG: hypothetical protein JSW46_08205 [Gemmatimonadota bacterium]